MSDLKKPEPIRCLMREIGIATEIAVLFVLFNLGMI